MDSAIDSEINSIEDETQETSSLINESGDKKSEAFSEINDYDETEDTRSELKFDEVVESENEKRKRLLLEKTIANGNLNIKTLRNLAISEHGFVNDNLRKVLWPLLLEVDTDLQEVVPSLDDLSKHQEYNQVVLDVNRSLKRFPPGIPYKQRLALQDQLTVLILRVIIKYPHLQYYQGYHDVAITFLLVVGEVIAFRIMERLSTDHLKECMEPTMEKTSYRLNYIYSILYNADRQLYQFMERAMVGTMFALPWFLTWFGHSLNQYRDVVRLYDYFLANPPLMPLYVAASVVMERRQEVFEVGCDMASIHCLLSQIPDDLDFEEILKRASHLYNKYPPHKMEKQAKARKQQEIEARKRDELRMKWLRSRKHNVIYRITNYLPAWLMLHYRNKYGLLFATATVLIGIYAYWKASEENMSLFRWSINS